MRTLVHHTFLLHSHKGAIYAKLVENSSSLALSCTDAYLAQYTRRAKGRGGSPLMLGSVLRVC